MIYLLRHGESSVNVAQMLSCRNVDEPLTELGIEQAEQVAAWLADKPIRRILSSPLRRARQTAEIVARQLGLEFAVAEELREIDCGALEGRTDIEAWKAFQHIVIGWFAGELDRGFEGGENGHHAKERFARLMHALDDDGDSLLVGHSGIFAFGLFTLCPGFTMSVPRDFYLPNTGIVLVDRTTQGFTCLKWGLADHLQRPSARDIPDGILE